MVVAACLAFTERFGEPPVPDDRLWERGADERLAFSADVERNLGVTFRYEDIEFLDTVEDLNARGVALPWRGIK